MVGGGEAERRYIDYGWVIVGVSFITLALVIGSWYSFTVYFVAMLKDFGWSRANLAGSFALNSMIISFLSPLVGHLIDRHGPRKIMPHGLVILAIGLVASSRINSLLQLYLFYGVISALGFTFLGYVPHSTILSNWFIKRRGAAMGLAFGGIGAGMLVMVPLSQSLIDYFGWRSAYIINALLLVAIVGPLVLIFQRLKPEEKGLLPDGVPRRGQGASEQYELKGSQVRDIRWASTNWTLGKAIVTYRFWFCFLMILSGAFAMQSVVVHQVAYFVDIGYTSIFGASMVGLVGIMRSIGQISWGAVSDWIGREQAYTHSSILALIALLFLLYGSKISYTFGPYIFAIFFGLGTAALGVLPSAISADIFQGKNFGSIFGFIDIGFGVGASIGPWISGLIFDLTGSYYIALTLAFFSFIFSGACCWIVSPAKVRLVGGKAASVNP